MRRNWLEEAYPDEDEDEDEEAETRADDSGAHLGHKLSVRSKPRASPLVEAKPHPGRAARVATLQFLSTVSNGNPQGAINVLSSSPLASVVVPRLEPGMLAAAYDVACARMTASTFTPRGADRAARASCMDRGTTLGVALLMRPHWCFRWSFQTPRSCGRGQDVPSLPLITLIAILSSDELACYGREESVLEMALAWLRPKSREAMSAAPHLRKTIRWSELDKDTVRAIMFLPLSELFPDVSLVAATDTDEVLDAVKQGSPRGEYGAEHILAQP